MIRVANRGYLRLPAGERGGFAKCRPVWGSDVSGRVVVHESFFANKRLGRGSASLTRSVQTRCALGFLC